MRYERLAPRFMPLIVLAVLPVASAIAGVRGLSAGGPRRWHAALLGLAAVELLWAVVASAMIGFAIAFRSG